MFLLVAFIVEALLGLTSASCEAGYVTFYSSNGTETCFRFAVDMERTWAQGLDHCHKQEAHLAYLEDNDLFFGVRNFILESGWTPGFHIGGTDEVYEGQWMWIHPEEPMTMGSHWAPDEPNGDRDQNFACLWYTKDCYLNSCINEELMFTLCMKNAKV